MFFVNFVAMCSVNMLTVAKFAVVICVLQVVCRDIIFNIWLDIF